MSSKIIIVCFDINDENKKDSKENILELESPLRIFDEFQDIHLFFDSEKIKVNSSETKYIFTFKHSEENQIIFEVYILNNLSFLHDVSLNAEANLIFINLENQNTLEQLEKIVNYINNCCFPIEITTYIIGIYKDNKDNNNPIIDIESIEDLFEEKQLNYEMYQIKYNEKDEPNHICLYQNKDIIHNKNIKKKKNNSKNYKDNYNLIDIVEKLLIRIYEIKINKYSNMLYKDDPGRSNCVGNSCSIF